MKCTFPRKEVRIKRGTVQTIRENTTDPADETPEFVIGAYHQLKRSEKFLQMSKRDLLARPIYHQIRESIDAQLAWTGSARLGQRV